MAIVTLSHVTKSYGANLVLKDVSMHLSRGEKVGLIGANGTGKTTLLEIVAGGLAPDEGEAHRARNLRIGYLLQEPKTDGEVTVLEEARKAVASADRVADEMRRVLLRMSSAEGAEQFRKLAARYADLENRFEAVGGYGIESKIERVLSGLGFAPSDFSKEAGRLSGGEQSRLALAKVLLVEPDLLLLDEPTNHLDIAAVEWLEKFLGQFPGAAVIVSHDRYFLNKVVSAILELEGHQVKRYPGSYDKYVELKEATLLARQRAYEQQQARIEHDEDFIRRYRSGQRHREARGRQKKLDRLERIEKPVSLRTLKKLQFQTHSRGGDIVIELKSLKKSFGDRMLFEGLDLDMVRGDRVGVMGPNGAGKTTLIRIMLGNESPSAGSVRLGRSVRPAYLPQDRRDLDPEKTVLEELAGLRPDLKEGEIRNCLGRFLFTQDEVFKKVEVLSGGEQTRLALAKLMLSSANFLLLDEPTNHLDIPSRVALEQALRGYPGTFLLVSHDRYLLDNTVSMLVVFEEGRAKIHRGNYSSYAGASQGKAAPAAATGAKPAEPRRRGRRRPDRPEKKPEVAELEAAIVRKEEILERLSHSLATPQTYDDPGFVRKLKAECESVQKELADLYWKWERTVREENG